jgi:iron complex transport system permease protein
MKVTLDLDALVKAGRITPDEAERLKGFAAADTGALGANILYALGATAVACGIAAFLPTLETLVALGVVLFGAGLFIRMQGMARLQLFAQIILVIGALSLCTGLGGLYGDNPLVRVGLTLGLAVAAVLARSGLLAALAVIAFAVTITFDPEIWPPNHFVAVVVVALSALVLVLYLISLRLPGDYERLAIIAMRVAIVMVNVAFFVGSLFGDDRLGLSGMAFSIAWALALLAFGGWAVFANRRWVVNSVAVFGAIHFFTQWFIVLGAQPLSILGGGVLLIVFGLALARFNNWVGQRPALARG